MMSDSKENSSDRSSKTNVYSSLVYVGIASSVMFFAGLSSAVLVRKMDKFWVNINLPEFFAYSTLVILLSSITLVLSLRAAKKGATQKLKLFLMSSVLLGFAFCVFQVFGWKQYFDNGNAVKSSVIYGYGQYGQSYYLTKNEEKISYNGNNYVLANKVLSKEDISAFQRFTYQICGNDYGYRPKDISFAQYNQPFAVNRTSDNRQLQFIDGKPTVDGILLSEKDRDELFKFAFGVYHNRPYFMLEGEYGVDFSISMNGEELEYDKKKFYKKEIKYDDFSEDLKKQINLDEQFIDGLEVLFKNENGDNITRKLILNENNELVLEREEIGTVQNGELVQTSNISSGFVYALTGAHFIHILLGLIILIVVFKRATKNRYNENNQAGLKAGSIFWHFVGLLWVYLYVFLEYIN